MRRNVEHPGVSLVVRVNVVLLPAWALFLLHLTWNVVRC